MELNHIKIIVVIGKKKTMFGFYDNLRSESEILTKKRYGEVSDDL